MKYKKLRNNVHRHIEEAKSNYFTSLLQNSSKLWKAFKQVLPTKQTSNITSLKVDEKTIFTAKSIADGFNQFFMSIENKLAECFTYETENSVNVIAACQSSFTLGPITSEFVSKTINQLKPNKATSLDKLISACMLKDAVTVITPSLTQLFNLSIQTKTDSQIWRYTKSF